MQEIWKDIPGFVGYQVSDYGNVRCWLKKGKSSGFEEIPRIVKLTTKFSRCRLVYYRLAIRKSGDRKVHYFSIHRLVWQTFVGLLGDKEVIDHKNGDTSDNRLENLRVASWQQNDWNKRSKKNGFKGVYRTQEKKAWKAAITVSGSVFHLGYFDCAVAAARAYNEAALHHFGEFASLNHISDEQ